MNVVLDEVDKEVTKVKKLVKEVNEGKQFWYIYTVIVEEVIIKWFQNDLVLNKEVDVEVNQEVDKEVANVVNEQVIQKFWLFMGKVLTNTDVVQKCSHARKV